MVWKLGGELLSAGCAGSAGGHAGRRGTAGDSWVRAEEGELVFHRKIRKQRAEYN